MTCTLIGKQAVVVGAGMAGLPAARALSDFFEHVVVLERDTLPTDASYRAGTAQSKHVHALLGGGQRALSELFPGFEQDLAAAGAVPLRVGLDVRIEMPGFDPCPRRDLGWINYSMSRPLIELIVRERVERHPKSPSVSVAALDSPCRHQTARGWLQSTSRMVTGRAKRFLQISSSTPRGAGTLPLLF